MKGLRVSYTIGIIVIFLLQPIKLCAQLYQITDLGDLPGGLDESVAYEVNLSGEVVGKSAAATGTRGFTWNSGTGMVNLGELSGGANFSWADGINNMGQKVGWSEGPTGLRAVLWDSQNNILDLGDLAGGNDESYARAVNDSGTVVGASRSTQGLEAFIWDSVNGMVGIGDLPGGAFGSVSMDINSTGTVTGYGEIENSTTRGFVWTADNGMQDIGALTVGGYSLAFGINNNGQVVGRSGVVSGEHAFLWDSTNGMTDLGDLPGGADFSYATAINNSGLVSGFSEVATSVSHAFIFDSVNGMQDMNLLIDSGSTGWELRYAGGLNDAGQIVGWGYKNGSIHAFLATPVPEPAALPLLMSLLLLIRRRN